MSEEEIKRIEEEIRKTPYHKATQKHIGKLKAKLALLRAAPVTTGKKGVGYSVKKTGDATVLLVGFPSVGKSTLLSKLTNAESKVAQYDFTTVTVIPGMLEYKSAKIQILDVPGVIEGVAEGKGRGREILSVIRNADLILILIDAREPETVEVIKKELYKAGFRLDTEPPDVRVYRRNTGGLKVATTRKLKLSKETIRSIVNEFGIYNADILIRGAVDEDKLIDALMKNRVYVKTLVVANKTDVLSPAERGRVDKAFIPVSAKEGENIEQVKKAIWEKLDLMRIYLKKIGKEPDMEEPFIMKQGSTIRDVAKKIHSRVFGQSVKYARIWGPSARFAGQKKGLASVLRDKDVVELHTK